MAHEDLRSFIEFVEQEEDLRHVTGADERYEIGAIAELTVHEGSSPALLCDEIPGYPDGHRVLVNPVASVFRWLAAAGFEPTQDVREAVLRIREADRRNREFHAPAEVSSGPVLENVTEDGVDVTQFPAPIWHEEDGGPYIGTADMVVTRNAESGDVNVGTYRTQVHGPDSLTAYISPGKDGRINRRSYLENGEPCPMVVSVGHPPDLFLASGERLPSNINELEFAGGIRGEPIAVVTGELTGLPIPAHSELVFEGHVYPDAEPLVEGPFGEWTGYYAGGRHRVKPMRVERIYHRNEPIVLGSPPIRPPARTRSAVKNAAALWDELDGSGIPGIQEVSAMEFGPGWFEVVSIDQQYGGHATQVGHHAASGPADAYHGRFTVVVDDDIDVYDQDAVMWAICSRCDPATDIDIVENCWSTSLDPTISPKQREENDLTNSRAVIDATRPYHWRDEFPPVVGAPPELRTEVRERWGDLLE